MLEVNSLSALHNFLLLNFTVSPGEKFCFSGCFSVDVTIHHESRKHTLGIEKSEWNTQGTGKEKQVWCPNQPLHFESKTTATELLS